MDEFIDNQLEKDRVDFLNERLNKYKPRVFKNFVDSNANMLR